MPDTNDIPQVPSQLTETTAEEAIKDPLPLRAVSGAWGFLQAGIGIFMIINGSWIRGGFVLLSSAVFAKSDKKVKIENSSKIIYGTLSIALFAWHFLQPPNVDISTQNTPESLITTTSTPPITSTPTPEANIVSREDFGEEWPFTVESGEIQCLTRTVPGSTTTQFTIWFVTDGIRYPINGTAQALARNGSPSLQSIWADSGGGLVQGSPLKKSLGPIIDYCR